MPEPRRRRVYTKEQRAPWRKAWLDRAHAARDAYRAGIYVVGSFHREASCGGCGQIFPVWRGETAGYCSRKCAASRLALPLEERLERRRHRQRRLDRARYQPAVPTTRTCVECQRMFDAIGHRVVCSDACAALRETRRNRERFAQVKFCPSCGAVFMRGGGTGRKRFCSNACGELEQRRRSAKKYRARKRTTTVESVDPLLVFERAGWRCYLCGCDTPRELRGTCDPRAPELEHIVPLARGGTHTYANVACACRGCNGLKGDSLAMALPTVTGRERRIHSTGQEPERQATP